ncbi:hypothetical protein BESB_010430 [Besnoitia besnoiti]|uniref:AAA+ ATPase domain-containing protein n=1 Tax=Besnoitia besnoiti TaxID=94643 RepID=A0A2A9MPQ1_BESBE|nr:hypothetical protein BESB_010430 [Besnoitia besnoiti]PFH38701.1 hypothetical protein BESB_010430 [Besnoitia besnoiti]
MPQPHRELLNMASPRLDLASGLPSPATPGSPRSPSGPLYGPFPRSRRSVASPRFRAARAGGAASSPLNSPSPRNHEELQRGSLQTGAADAHDILAASRCSLPARPGLLHLPTKDGSSPPPESPSSCALVPTCYRASPPTGTTAVETLPAALSASPAASAPSVSAARAQPSSALGPDSLRTASPHSSAQSGGGRPASSLPPLVGSRPPSAVRREPSTGGQRRPSTPAGRGPFGAQAARVNPGSNCLSGSPCGGVRPGTAGGALPRAQGGAALPSCLQAASPHRRQATPQGAPLAARVIRIEQGRRVVQFDASTTAAPRLPEGPAATLRGPPAALPASAVDSSVSGNFTLSTGMETADVSGGAGRLAAHDAAAERGGAEAALENSSLSPEPSLGQSAGACGAWPALAGGRPLEDPSREGDDDSATSQTGDDGSLVAQALRSAAIFGALSENALYFKPAYRIRRASSPATRVPQPARRLQLASSYSRAPAKAGASSSSCLAFYTPSSASPSTASAAALLGSAVRHLPLEGANRIGLCLSSSTRAPAASPAARARPSPRSRELTSSALGAAGSGRARQRPRGGGPPPKAHGVAGSATPGTRGPAGIGGGSGSAAERLRVPTYFPTLCGIFLEGRRRARSESSRAQTSAAAAAVAATADNRSDAEAPSGEAAAGGGRTFKGKPVASPSQEERPTTETELSTASVSTVGEQLLLRAEGLVGADGQAQAPRSENSPEEALKHVATGEDAIAFFSRYGATTSTTFLYCNRKKAAEDEADQYSLVVVPEKEIEPEHFTISATGIVHICPGRPSEYMTLSDFSHQAFAFSVLRSMLFFKTFLQRKLISSWRDNVRRLTYRRQRAKLTRRLFFAKPVFVEHLFEVLGILARLRSVTLIQVPPASQLQDLSTFCALQSATRSDVKTGSAKAIEALQHLVHKSLQRLLSRLHEATLLPDDDPLEVAASSRSKSMVQELQEARERARLLRLAFSDEARFGDFVRLVDTAVAVRLVDAVTAAALGLRERLGEANACSKLFRVQVHFGRSPGVEFSPSLDQFQGALRELWEGAVNIVGGVPFFASSRLYEDFVKLGDRHPVDRLLESATAFLRIKDDVERRLTRDFERARRYADAYFAVYRQIHDYGQAWDEAAFCAGIRSHDELSDEMESMKDFQARLEKLNPTHVVGLFSIQAQSLKSALAPIAENALAALKRLLLQRTREHLRETVVRYEQTNAALDDRPAKLLPFAEFVKTYKYTRRQIDDLDHARATADDMFALLKQYQVRVAVEDTILLENLNAQALLFEKEKLLGAAEHIRRHMDEMLADLKQKSDQVEREMKAVASDLSEEQFLNVKRIEAALAVLESLHKYDRRIQALDAKAAALQQTQQLLNPEGAFVFKNTEAAKKLVKPKLKLWACAYEWETSTTQWSAEDVSELNGEEVQARVKHFANTLQQLERELQSNDAVVETLQQRVQLWRQRLPTIIALNNPALKPRHWEKIFALLRLEGGLRDRRPTLKELEEGGVFEEADAVAEISSCASAELALEATLTKVRGALEQLEFATKSLGENQDCFIVDDVSDVSAQLEELAVSVQSMLFSPYVAALRSEVDAWRAKLALTLRVLREMVVFQRAWISFEGVFAQGDLDRVLPSEAAAFKQMNAFWARTMRRLRTETANVVETATAPGFLEALQQFNLVIERMQQSMEAYLETKRRLFPRFYFLANEELLCVLAARSPEAMQTHVPKCFDGIQRVVFSAAGSARPPPLRSGGSLQLSPRASAAFAPRFRRTSDVARARFGLLGAGDRPARPPPQLDPDLLGPEDAGKEETEEGDEEGSAAAPASRSSAAVSFLGQTAEGGARLMVASGLLSSAGEFVQFPEFAAPSRSPERFFRQVEQSMQVALYSQLQEAMQQYPAALPPAKESPVSRASGNPFEGLAHAEGDCVRGSVDAKRASSLGAGTADKNYLKWLRAHPAQCVALVESLFFTAQVERALDRDKTEYEERARNSEEAALADASRGVERRPSDAAGRRGVRRPENVAACRAAVECNISRLVSFRRRKALPLKRAQVEALIVELLHRRDVVVSLEEAKCASAADFCWQRHMRAYWDADAQDCFILHHDMAFQYAYEFLGNASRLVSTPLTEKCFLTLTSALRLAYGGALSGPAGTGKSETIKDLAKILGLPCVVFNCSRELDFRMMARLFSGFAQAGTWGCLDEFNRIDVEVLSVVAQQIKKIQTALRAHLEVFEFEGEEIPLDARYGIFVSINPGYAGRAELPENLKSLFRPVAMVTPDLARIAEVTLFASGFRTAGTLARKMAALFEAAEKQLSSRPHYDFGMRAVKTVLMRAASLKEEQPDTSDEDYLLASAVAAVHLPRLSESDALLFHALLADAFSECVVRLSPPLDVKKAVGAELRRRELHSSDALVNKMLQLYETQAVRTGVIVVGDPGTGKSTCISVLAAALTELARGSSAALESEESGSLREENASPFANGGLEAATTVLRVNPKALELAALFGRHNPATKEWKEGIVGLEVLRAAHEAGRRWLVFDGPLDAAWAENLNSALDETRVLCLANGERMKVPRSLNFIFEVDNLANASPATVSRSGVVFLEDREWRTVEAVVASWRKRLERDCPLLASSLPRGTLEICKDALAFIRSECTEVVGALDVARVSTVCGLTSAWLADGETFSGADHQREALLAPMCWSLAMVWGLGGGLSEASRAKFARFLRPRLQAKCPEIGDVDDDLFSLAVHRESLSFVSLRALLLQRPPGDPDRRSEATNPDGDDVREGEDADSDEDEGDASICLRGTSNNAHKQGEGRRKGAAARGASRSTGREREKRKTKGEEGADHEGGDCAQSVHAIFVPTEQTMAHEMLLSQMLTSGMHCFLCGETGSGKTVSVAAYLRGLPADVSRRSLRFVSRTPCRALQGLLESSLVRRRRLSLGPGADQTRLVLHLDDVNMPAPDVSGAQRPLEFLRHLIDCGGFHDTESLNFKAVEDTSFILVAAPPHGGRPRVTQRLLRLTATLWHGGWALESLELVFGTLLREGISRALGTLVGEAMQAKLATATLETFANLPALLRPTPQTPHYTWDLRSLANLIQGLLQAKPETTPDETTVVRLWRHEVCRSFADGLTCLADRSRLQAFLKEQASLHFGLDFAAVIADEEDFIFTRLANGETLTGPYRLVASDASGLEDACARALEEYQLSAPLSAHAKPIQNFVFFADARRHFLRLCRILSLPHGNALLLGVEGSGRQSLVHIAASALDAPLHTIDVTRQYGPAEFREDLKSLIQRIAADKKPVVFLLADAQIRSEEFLEDLVSLMAAGEIPELFDADERGQLTRAGRLTGREAASATAAPLAACGLAEDTLEPAGSVSLSFGHSVAAAAGLPRVCKPEDAHRAWERLAQTVRERLHVVVAISPVGQTFRSRCRQLPSLRSCMTVDFIDAWPPEALRGVASHFLLAQPAAVPADTVATHSRLCAEFHATAAAAAAPFFLEAGRRVYVTASAYLEFIQAYLYLVSTQMAGFQEKMERYRRGISRLEETTKLVERLKCELLKSQPVLEKATRDTQDLRAALERDRKKADAVVQACAVESLAANAARGEAQALKDECEREISRVLPELMEALGALDALDKRDLQELKSFVSPPALVETVLQAVCLLTNRKQTWEEAKKLLNETTLLAQLRDFDKDHIPPRLLAQVHKLTSLPNFTPEKVNQVSKAATSLCMWVCAVEKYAQVQREMEPKKEQLALAEVALRAAEEKHAEKQAAVDEVEASIRKLEGQIEASRQRAEELQEQIAETQVRLARAEKLIRGVATEAVRWAAEATQLEKNSETLSGDMLLAAGLVAYGGPFTSAYRKALTAQWTAQCRAAAVRVSASFSLVGSLASQDEVREMTLAGLPGNQRSLENAVIATRCLCRGRCPLLVDPQGQAQKWLRQTAGAAPRARLGSSATLIGAQPPQGRSEGLAAAAETSREKPEEDRESPARAGIDDETLSCSGETDAGAAEARAGAALQAPAQSLRSTPLRRLSPPASHGSSGVSPREGLLSGGPATPSPALIITPCEGGGERSSAHGQEAALCAQREAAPPLLELKADEPKFLQQLVAAASVGTQVLVELRDDVLEHALDALLVSSTQAEGLAPPLICVGDQQVRRHRDFRLLFFTSNANPAFSPAVFARVTVINFAVTSAALEEQLLIEVVRRERPELEDERDRLARAIAEDERQKRLIEDQILKLLAGATGNLLAHDTLVDTLAASRATSQVIEARMREAVETAETLEKARANFRGVAARGALLFAVVESLARLHDMYRHSLPSFLKIFKQILSTEPQSGDVARRVALLQRELTLQVFRKTCRGLFEHHKMCFAFLLALAMDEASGGASPEEVEFLTRGGEGPACPEDAALANEKSQKLAWLSDRRYQALKALEGTSGAFAGLLDAIVADSEAWRELVSSDADFGSALPNGFDKKLSPLQTVLLVKALKPADLVEACRAYVRRQLGPEFVGPPPRSLGEAVRDSSAETPLLFLLSPGVDPTDEIRHLAEAWLPPQRLRQVSLGQGQAPRAEALVQDARQKGYWVCLQNCHLAPSFAPTLQRLHEEMRSFPVHPNFRLFLTSMPSASFPASVLSSAITITSEAPAGVRASLQRTYMAREETVGGAFAAVAERRDFQRVFFCLALFHALVLERRKFGALGWNNFYAWTSWDGAISQLQLAGYVGAVAGGQATEIPFEALTLLTAEINYGGRVTDAIDLRTLNTLLRRMLSPESLREDFVFAEAPLYRIPDAETLDGHLEFIESLPVHDPPRVKDREAKELLASLCSAYMRAGLRAAPGTSYVAASGAETVAELVCRLPPLLERPPTHGPGFESSRLGATKVDLSPLSVFLSHEIAKFNALLTHVRASLVELQQALSGSVLMSAAMEETHQALLEQRVPPAWTAVAFASTKLLAAWVGDLSQRVAHLRDWATRGPPKSFWISAFFRPEALFAAAIQTHARQHKVPMASLALKALVANERAPYQLAGPPPRGIYIHGLFLQGAGWDASEQLLCEAEPGVSVAPMPVILLEPVAATDEEPPPAERFYYACPLYKTLERKGTGNYVDFLDLQTDLSPEHWILRGVALLCQDDSP